VARNRGLEEVSTPFVLFLDDDDRLRRDGLGALESALASEPQSFAAVGGFEYFDGDGHTKLGAHPARRIVRDTWMEAVFGWVPLTGRTLFRTEAVRRVGGFPSGVSLGEDRDLWLRLARSAPVVLVPDVVLEHRLHSAQTRPADTRAQEAATTARHLTSLAEHDRRLGERIHRGREAYEDARARWENGQARAAVRALIGMRHVPPRLLLSPLVRRSWLPILGRASAAAVLGDRGLKRVRELLSLQREARGVEVWKPPYPKAPEHDVG